MKPIVMFMLVLLFFSLLVADVTAQSNDRDNPTRLTSNVISGDVGPDTTRENYHFSFVAGPGK